MSICNGFKPSLARSLFVSCIEREEESPDAFGGLGDLDAERAGTYLELFATGTSESENV